MLVGVESHVCVLQTAIDAASRGYEVYVPEDCVASRRESDQTAALAFMRSSRNPYRDIGKLLFMLSGMLLIRFQNNFENYPLKCRFFT